MIGSFPEMLLCLLLAGGFDPCSPKEVLMSSLLLAFEELNWKLLLIAPLLDELLICWGELIGALSPPRYRCVALLLVLPMTPIWVGPADF